jgi:hypothetical protein
VLVASGTACAPAENAAATAEHNIANLISGSPDCW